VLFGVRTELRAALRRAFGDRLHVEEQDGAGAMRARVQAAHDAAVAARSPGTGRGIAPVIGQTIGQTIGLVEPGGRFAVLDIADPPSALAVGTLQAFIDGLVAQGGAASVDYVHGDAVLERLGAQSGCAGFHFAGLGKHELLERVVHGGPLPRKTFSMGEAHEKRYYVEARRLR
jgi:hypothetical protein